MSCCGRSLETNGVRCINAAGKRRSADCRPVIDPSGTLSRPLVKSSITFTDSDQTYYVYRLGLIGEETDGVYRAYHFDQRGSTRALNKIKGVVTDTFLYGPYGELVNHEGNSTTPFQFNDQFGVQTDPNGLLYMQARYSNPAIKRFINQDAGFGSIDPGISLNRFAFANGNPVDGIDPFGLAAFDHTVFPSFQVFLDGAPTFNYPEQGDAGKLSNFQMDTFSTENGSDQPPNSANL